MITVKKTEKLLNIPFDKDDIKYLEELVVRKGAWRNYYIQKAVSEFVNKCKKEDENESNSN